MQDVGGPVGRQIAAMAPHRAELHPAEPAPDIAPGADVLAVEHHPRRGALRRRHDLFGHGRRFPERAPADEEENPEHRDEQDAEQHPESLYREYPTVVHGASPEPSARDFRGCGAGAP